MAKIVADRLVDARGDRRPRAYGERAKHRLRIAAGLLHRRDLTLDRLGDSFYTVVLDHIFALDPGRRERLRGQVDWVEAYERTESRRRPRHRAHVRDRPQRRTSSA